MDLLQKNAMLSVELLSDIPGINVVAAQGAMYLMLGIDIKQFKNFKDDLDFVEQLVAEQAVLCLPGKCFRCPTPFVRIVTSSPIEVLEEAFLRIKKFCANHHI